MSGTTSQKTVIVGAGPVGALAALYAAQRGHDVEVYELRSGTSNFVCSYTLLWITILDHKSLQAEERIRRLL
jgi:2-polyprenyl-6-methoxyphenol hydroxylase-like FAD-dependent oxidoreductase